MRRVLGCAEAEVLRRYVALIVTPEDHMAGAPEAEMRTALTEGVAENERWHVKHDGARYGEVGQLTSLPEGDGLVGSLRVTRDRTVRLRVRTRARAGASARGTHRGQRREAVPQAGRPRGR